MKPGIFSSGSEDFWSRILFRWYHLDHTVAANRETNCGHCWISFKTSENTPEVTLDLSTQPKFRIFFFSTHYLRLLPKLEKWDSFIKKTFFWTITNFLKIIITKTNRVRSESLESRVEQMGIRTKKKNVISSYKKKIVNQCNQDW